MPDQHELSAFAEVLNSAEKPILVGGQAVNLWAT
jgi:thiamine pyrophosphate-dependent acetolactate synthase large subunit-like protein